jgi:hypothetical protein
LGRPYSPPMADGRQYHSLILFLWLLLWLVFGGLFFSGKILEKFGEKSVIAFRSGCICILFALFAALPALWSEKWFLVSFVIAGELLSIAVNPICMRLCLPTVAATQFVIYMSISNLGTLLGAFLPRATQAKATNSSFSGS